METSHTLEAATTPSGKPTEGQQLEAPTPATMAPPSTSGEDDSVFVVHSKALYDDPSIVAPSPELPQHPVTTDIPSRSDGLESGVRYDDHPLIRTTNEDKIDRQSDSKLDHQPSNTSYADHLVSTIAQPRSHLSEIPDSRLESSVTQSDAVPASVAPADMMSDIKSYVSDAAAPSSVAPVTSDTAVYPATMSTPAESEASPDYSEPSASPLLVVTRPQLQSSTDTQAVMDAAVVHSHDENSFSVPTEPEDETSNRTMLRMGISSTIVEAPSTPQHTELPEGESMENEEPLTTPTRSPPVSSADVTRETTDEVTVITPASQEGTEKDSKIALAPASQVGTEEPSEVAPASSSQEGTEVASEIAQAPTSQEGMEETSKVAAAPALQEGTVEGSKITEAADDADIAKAPKNVTGDQPPYEAEGDVPKSNDGDAERNLVEQARDASTDFPEETAATEQKAPTSSENDSKVGPEAKTGSTPAEEAAADMKPPTSIEADSAAVDSAGRNEGEATESSRLERTDTPNNEIQPSSETKADLSDALDTKEDKEITAEPTAQKFVADSKVEPEQDSTSIEPSAAVQQVAEGEKQLSSSVEVDNKTATSPETAVAKIEFGVAKPPVSEPLQPVVCDLGSQSKELVVEPVMSDAEVKSKEQELASGASAASTPENEKDVAADERQKESEDIPKSGDVEHEQSTTAPAIVLSPSSGMETSIVQNDEKLAEKTAEEAIQEEAKEKAEAPAIESKEAKDNEVQYECVMAPGAGEDPMVMAVPIAPGRIAEEMQEVVTIQKSTSLVTKESKSPFKKKRGPSVFTSKPAESQADASAFKAVDIPADKPAVYTSTPEPAQVAASALKPVISPRTTQTVFTNKASRSFADASALTPATPRTQEKSIYESSASPSRADVTARDTIISPRSQEKIIYESEARPSYSDAGANTPAPLSARAQRALYESHASPSNADATATSPQVTVQKKSVFVSQAAPSVASIRHSDEAPMPKDQGVYESKALPSTAHARANDEGVKPAEAVMAFVSHPMPSVADVKSTDPPRVMSRGMSGMFVNEPEPSRSEAKWDASLDVKQEKTIFESTPKVERAADVTWKDPALANPGPSVFVNTPAPSMADTSASRDVEIEDDDEEEEAGESSVVV